MIAMATPTTIKTTAAIHRLVPVVMEDVPILCTPPRKKKSRSHSKESFKWWGSRGVIISKHLATISLSSQLGSATL